MSSQKETPGTPTAFAKLPAQDVLPFPPTPSASIAGRTMQESVYSGASSRAVCLPMRRTS